MRLRQTFHLAALGLSGGRHSGVFCRFRGCPDSGRRFRLTPPVARRGGVPRAPSQRAGDDQGRSDRGSLGVRRGGRCTPASCTRRTVARTVRSVAHCVRFASSNPLLRCDRGYDSVLRHATSDSEALTHRERGHERTGAKHFDRDLGRARMRIGPTDHTSAYCCWNGRPFGSGRSRVRPKEQA